MKRTITPAEMQAMERRFMRDTGYPGLLLMEHAALALLNALAEMAPPNGRVLFVCGSGNNGGDGLALARLWRQRGGESVVWLTVPSESLPSDARTNAAALSGWDVPVHIIEETLPIPEGTSAVVDALFGTGLSRPMEGIAALLIKAVNESGLPILAVDIPSGIDGGSGHVQGVAVQATRTVAFHRPKPGHYLFPGRLYAGVLDIADIGIPGAWDGVQGHTVLEPEDLPALLPRRALDAHKGDNGHVLLIAGSLGMAGAAAFSAMAAGYAGAGLTTIACPESILPTLQALVPGAMAVPLPEAEGQLAENAAERIAALLPGKTCLALGPGLGRGSGVAKALQPAFESELPKVMDADALYALGMNPMLPKHALFTPHPGEMRRLCGAENTEDITSQPVQRAAGFVSGTDAVLLLKGATTVLARDGEVALNITGTPGMAVGGSGDVLTGILAALLAQGLSRWDAARVGALLHGMAGRDAAGEKSRIGMTAPDLAHAIPQVLLRAEEANNRGTTCAK